MPLDLSGLTSELESIASNPPEAVEDCASAWAAAVADYASGIIPASAAVAGAEAALASGLTTAFSSAAAAPGMETAFTAFAATVGAGMAGYTPVPPPAPVGFATQFAGSHPTTHAAAASAIASLIDTWMKTGTATLIAPPNTLIPWS